MISDITDIHSQLLKVREPYEAALDAILQKLMLAGEKNEKKLVTPPKPAHRIGGAGHSMIPPVPIEGVHAGSLPAPRQKLIDTLLFLSTAGETMPSKVQLALWAGVSPKSSAYANNLGALRSAGLIEYPLGLVALTDEGLGYGNAENAILNVKDMHQRLFERLSTPQGSIMRHLLQVYPRTVPRDELATVLDMSPASSAYANNLGSLRSMGVLDYPSKGEIKATDICFLGFGGPR